MNGQNVEDWQTVYNGARSADMVFVLDDGRFDCFDMVKFNSMTDLIDEYRKTAETITKLRGQLQNCVSNLERAKRKLPRENFDQAIASANKALYETL